MFNNYLKLKIAEIKIVYDFEIDYIAFIIKKIFTLPFFVAFGIIFSAYFTAGIYALISSSPFISFFVERITDGVFIMLVYGMALYCYFLSYVIYFILNIGDHKPPPKKNDYYYYKHYINKAGTIYTKNKIRLKEIKKEFDDLYKCLKKDFWIKVPSETQLKIINANNDYVNFNLTNFMLYYTASMCYENKYPNIDKISFFYSTNILEYFYMINNKHYINNFLITCKDILDKELFNSIQKIKDSKQ